MFAQRFDPALLERKRRLEDEDVESVSEEEKESEEKSEKSENSEDESEDESESESESDEISDEVNQGSEVHSMDVDEADEEEDEADETDDAEDDGANEGVEDMSEDEISEDMSEDEISEDKDMKDKDMKDNDISEHKDINDGSNDDINAADDGYISKHSGVFSKFKKSLTTPQPPLSSKPSDQEVHDIAPMPQPELPRDERLALNNSKNLDWLAEPIYGSPDWQLPFSELSLSETVLKNLASLGLTSAFSVQISVISMLLQDMKENKLKPDSNGDVLVNASTGSGKTLAYLIPLIEGLKDRVVPRIRAIILVPTKPLINQVKQTLLQLSKGTNVSIMNLKSDVSLKEEAQKLRSQKPDIVVSTPGRLVDHISGDWVDLRALRFLVIDEADRLLNQSFQNWCNVLINKIESYEPSKMGWKPPVQKLIFSATLTTDAGRLSLLKFYKPRLIIINEEKKLVNEMFTVPKTLNEYWMKYGTSKASLKPLILGKFLIKTNKLSNVLIFTKSNESSIRLSKLLSILFAKLQHPLSVEYLNSMNNSSSVRQKILKQFQAGTIQVLVVTDLIARGIDIASITDVVNYDLPNSSREYIHRVGRTARANNEGDAYTLVFGKGEEKFFKGIMKDINRNGEVELEEMELIEDTDVYQQALVELKEIKSLAS